MISSRGSVLKKFEINGNRENDLLNEEFANFKMETTTHVVIDAVTEYRPDLLSIKYLGTAHLGWLIAKHNGFHDAIFDFKKGTVVKIPNAMDYYVFQSQHNEEDFE